ncbi:hypothetical protein ES702_04464 [subsurface metagenome]
MNKKARINSFGWMLISIFILAVILTIFLSMNLIRIENNDCLREIAENYCEEKGLFYGDHIWDIGNKVFYCVEDEREISYDKIYKFTKEEFKKCMGK